MTGWRVGWMIGPTRRDQGVDQLPERTPPRTVERIAQRAALAAVFRLARRRGDDAHSIRTPSKTMHRMLNEIPGVTCIEPPG